MLLAEAPHHRLEPTLLPLHSLGLAPARGVRDDARLGLLFTMGRLLRLGGLVYPHKLVPLLLELEASGAVAGNRGVELEKVHWFVCVVLRCSHGLTVDNTRFFRHP